MGNEITLYGGRVIVIDADPRWGNIFQEILAPSTEFLAIGPNLHAAEQLLDQQYFNLAVVDVGLNPLDRDDEQGFQFMQMLNHRGLIGPMQSVMLSTYSNVEWVRRSFHEFGVTDFLDKKAFDEQRLLATLDQALKRNHLGRKVEIEITYERHLPDLWAKFNWPKNEDPLLLEAELRDLLIRLFPGATHLFIEDMPTGQSGAGILRITPTYANKIGKPDVIKFGKREKINQERDRYQEHVDHFVGNQCATQLRTTAGSRIGAIAYSLIGTELDNVQSFAHFYQLNDAETVKRAIDKLFSVTCKRWYDNLEQPRRKRDLTQLYKETLHIDWSAVAKAINETNVEITDSILAFPGLAGGYPHPQTWLTKNPDATLRQVWRSITHGDLNENNLLLSADGQGWLIDFYRTGLNHVLSDVIELETAIKFNLTGIDSLREQGQ